MNIGDNNALIVDAMAILQALKGKWKTFGEFADSIFHYLVKLARECKANRLDFVADRKEKCLLITSGTTQTEHVSTREVPQLECDHEEADTRLLLHYKAAALSHQRIIIKSPDTDVFVLFIAMQKTIGKELLMTTGTGNKFRLIDISSILNVLDEELCACLPGFHGFSGCDSTSAFLGKGKVKPWKALQMNPRFMEIFSQLGRSAEVSDELVVSLGTFVCLLYGEHVLMSADTSFLSQASIPTMFFLQIVTAFGNTLKEQTFKHSRGIGAY
ncbi:Hypothetical predicted protein [Paramuricea clavata]|uniref:Uncharacterized protein n=1 Tax=Paramuricea clavata TaxID=317549 RepID=A0A6S7GN85_PARCT|nr:Hypothetical predicted protein [Paramuricea clavata]